MAASALASCWCLSTLGCAVHTQTARPAHEGTRAQNWCGFKHFGDMHGWRAQPGAAVRIDPSWSASSETVKPKVGALMVR
jgi:hypothetical protein